MSHPERDDLERVVDRALRRLPAPTAPGTLLPRVMAAVAARETARRGLPPWLAWPLGWQVVSAAAVVLVVLGVTTLAQGVDGLPQWISNPALLRIAHGIEQFGAGVSALLTVSRALWQGLFEPFIGYALVFVVVMSAACITFVAALGRVALGGVSHS
jgi:hypothetical protein